MIGTVGLVPSSSFPAPSLLGFIYPGKRQDIGNPKGYFEALKAMGANE